MKCPYCGKREYIPDYVVANIENYGSKTVKFRCLHCKKVVRAYGSRQVEFSNITQTDQPSDWT